jgi:hypothetical protein
LWWPLLSRGVRHHGRNTTVRRFSAQELDKLGLVVGHFHLLQYGMGQEFSPQLERMGITSPVAKLFNTFALMHLISTMFLLDKGGLPMGGFCYRTLAELGLANKLQPIRRTLESKVGKTTFGDFIRHQRNKLGTHGNLLFSNLPAEAEAVPGSPRAIAQFERAMDRLENQAATLRIVLENLLKRERARHDKHTSGRTKRSTRRAEKTARA